MTQKTFVKLLEIQVLCRGGKDRGTDDAIQETLSLLLDLLPFWEAILTKDEYLDRFKEVNEILSYVSKNLDLFHRDIAVLLCFLSTTKNYTGTGLLPFYPVLYQKVKDHFLTFEEKLVSERVDSLLKGLEP